MQPKTSTIRFEEGITDEEKLLILAMDKEEDIRLKNKYPKTFQLCKDAINYPPIKEEILIQLKRNISG